MINLLGFIYILSLTAGKMRELWRRTFRLWSARAAHYGAGVQCARRAFAGARVRATMSAPFPADVPHGALRPPARIHRHHHFCSCVRAPDGCPPLHRRALAARPPRLRFVESHLELSNPLQSIVSHQHCLLGIPKVTQRKIRALIK